MHKHHGQSTVHNKPTCSHQPRVGWYGSMYGFLEVFSLLACYPFIKNPFFPGSSKEHVCTDVKSFVSLETYVVLCLFFNLLRSFSFPQLLWKLFLSVFQVTHMWCCLIQRFCTWNFDLHSVSMPEVCVPPPGLSS